MLFSNDQIVQYINDNFEPAWMTVRPVPTVNIDFGNGKTITRTLHGNIATYVCTSAGKVLDIIPGVYEPNEYRLKLDQLAKLHRWVTSSEVPAERLQTYHTTQRDALARGEAPHLLAMDVRPTIADFSKVLRIERPVELTLLPQGRAQAPQGASAPPGGLDQMLKEDTRYNEAVRRPKVHARLAASPMQKPAALTAWLYRDVLDADLDDPYLGLGDLLFDDYPFTAEEAAAAKKDNAQ